MTKAYYTSALKATYMEIEFGVESSNKAKAVEFERFTAHYPYIHPDSMEHFEPKVGDLVHIVRGFTEYWKKVDSEVRNKNGVITGIWSNGEHWDVGSSEPLHDLEIIQRDNKPFMWPIFEEE